MQMGKRGRQRGEIYSWHESGASVSEIHSVIRETLPPRSRSTMRFFLISARIIDNEHESFADRSNESGKWAARGRPCYLGQRIPNGAAN